MNFFSKHGEKLLLTLILVGLAASAVLGISSLSGLENPATLKLKAPEANVSLELDVLDATLERLTEVPPQLDVEIGSFTPEIRVNSINPEFPILIPVDAEVCPYTGTEQTIADIDSDEGGILDSVERQYGMDPADPTDELADMDGDGFPNLLEHQLGTDLSDSSSTPDQIQFVRLKEIIDTSIVFELRGTARFGEAYTLQLYWKYPDEDRGTTEFIKTGRKFGRNNEFLAESFTEKTAFVDGKSIDQSLAVIRSGQDEVNLGRNIDNRRGAITEVSAIIGTIFGPEWEQEVRLGQSFEMGSLSYMIVDIQRDAVVVQPDAETTPLPDPIVIVETTREDERMLKKFDAAPAATRDDPSDQMNPPLNIEDSFLLRQIF